MKKSISLFILSVVLFSCTTENELVYQELSTAVPELNKRSLTEALGIAQEAASLFNGKSRNVESRTIDMGNIQYLCSNPNSRSQNDDTLLYVINYADDKGFAVVSANPNTVGLIALTEKGTYSPTSEEISNNGGMKMYMDMAKMYVSDPNNELQRSGPVTMLEIFEKEDTVDTWIEPKLTVSWGQTWHEGDYCPNGVSGCTNTALAQIMTYFEYPTQIDITYEDAEINTLNLNWSEIKKYKSRYNDTASNIAHSAVSHLLRQLGKLTKTKYNHSPNTTSTATVEARTAMSSLGYTVSSSVQNYENENFLPALQNNNLVYMRGERSTEDGTVGHAWVIDGIFERMLHYMAYTREPNSELWTLHDESYAYYRYNHINWGWDGLCNGYFLEDVFKPGYAVHYDGTSYLYNYNYNLSLMYFLITK